MRNNSADRVNFIWSVADLLRGDYKQSDYGKVILPLVVIRRLDCVLEPTKEKVLAEYAALKGRISNVEPVLLESSGESFYNTSPLTFQKLLDDPERLADNLRAYINGFSPSTVEVLNHFGFDAQITTLDKAGLLYLVVGKFADIDLHPDVVSSHDMGYIFEELIRRFSEQSNETAGEHFTPREVIELMVSLLFAPDQEALSVPDVRRTMYDPTAGTGGMLSVAEAHLRKLNPDARLEVFGQELNPDSYAICRSDMMLKGQDPTHIALGNTLTQGAFSSERFSYMLSNPPFGVDWKKYEREIKAAAANEGLNGRFSAGLPRISDGSLLFLQHMISRMRPADEGGSRIAIVFNGSPLFSGDAGSGESEIRRWIIENDWLEAIVSLPDQLFYNTGIYTYFWIVTNRKAAARQGKVQLIDARPFSEKMPRSLGNKRNRLSDEDIAAITHLYTDFSEGEHSKILGNDELGYRRITVEQPLRLRYEVTDAGIESLRVAKAFLAMVVPTKGAADPQLARDQGELAQSNIIDGLLAMKGQATTDRDAFSKLLEPIISGLPVKLPAPAMAAIWSAVANRDPSAPIVTERKGRAKADPDLRDTEAVPLVGDLAEFMIEEVTPELPDAWIDEKKSRIGYEIPFSKLFYRYVAPRPLEEIDAEIEAVEREILELLAGVTR